MAERFTCPDCNAPLGRGAQKCRCGWRAPAEAALAVRCAHDLCQYPATLRRRLPTGWANLCAKHDAFHAQQESKQWCREHQLETVAQMRSYCFARVREIGKASPEHWMSRLEQRTVDLLARLGDRRALARLRGHGVIDRKNRLIPPELRETCLDKQGEGDGAATQGT